LFDWPWPGNDALVENLSISFAGARSTSEIVFIVEESPERGYTARALGPSIFTEADDWGELRANVRDAVSCHLEEDRAAKLIRLHFVGRTASAGAR
jgi:hypothetical protein